MSQNLVTKYSSVNNLNLIILPTEQCNFRCVYCYEDFKLGKMKPEVVEGIKNLLIARRDKLANLSVSWFGGEPLLAYQTVIEIMSYAKKELLYDTRIASSMTTNGYLLSLEKLKTLTELNVFNYQISFDGDQKEHDLLRLRADGMGTFNSIWKNLEDAHKSSLEFEITIRIHANRNNSDSIERLLGRVADAMPDDKRFKLFIRPLSRLGGPRDSQLPILEDNGQLVYNDKEVVKQLKQKATSLGLQLDHNEPVMDVCYASKLDTFMIRSDGRLGKCTVALYDDRNTIGELFRDGTVKIDAEKVKWWSRGLFSEDSSQLECPLNAKG